MEPKTVDINAELEKKTTTLLKGGWGADVAIGVCMRAARVAHDKRCEVLTAVVILELPTA
ncbi:unnamed protein product, partial [Prorocentrum cordatum]